MENVPEIGIGVLLPVNAQTKTMKKMFKGIRNVDGVSTIDPDKAHITLVGSSETAISIHSERDMNSLDQFRDEVGKFLGGLSLNGAILTPDGDRLEEFSGHFAIPIKERDYLLEMRKEIGEKAARLLASPIGNRDFIPHFSVAYRVGKKKRRFPDSQKIPGEIHVNGFTIDQRKEKPFDPRRSRSAQKYANRPINLRYKNTQG